MPAPTLSYISPDTGSTAGGKVVLIKGTDFTGFTSVTIGGVAAVSPQLVDNETIYAFTPPGTAGAVNVAITTPDGTATGVGEFTYEAPPATTYRLYLFDDCCHMWISEDTGNTFEKACTPGGPATPAPNDPGLDPNGIGTMLDAWVDCCMAINDADYETVVALDFDYDDSSFSYGIIGLSTSGGRNGTWSLIDPEPDAPAFVAANGQQNHARGAISANAETILLATWLQFGYDDPPPQYPRISRNGGATWSDVTGVTEGLRWSHACFGSEASQVMYLKESADNGVNARIWKSTDWGVTWTKLAGGPVFTGFLADEDEGHSQRMRCSADGQTIVASNRDGNFWLSKSGGTSWTNTDFSALFIESGADPGNSSDCSVTPDGNTIIVSFEQTINGGLWPAVFVSTDGGTTFDDVTLNLKYPASLGGDPLSPPPANTSGCNGCNVAPDGLGMVVTFDTPLDNGIVEPNGLQGKVMYANVSVDAGATWRLCSYDADPYENGSFLGLFTGIYITPLTADASSCPSSGFDLLTPPCVTAWTQCVRIERRDGVVFRFTSLDQDIAFRGETYLTCGSLDPSATQTTAQIGEVGNSELAGLITATGVDEEELYGGLFDDAFVEIWLVPYENADTGANAPRRLAAGWAGKITHSTRGYKMEVLGPGGRLEQRPIVQTYTPQCRWNFGDGRCTVDVTAFQIDGTVTSGINRGSLLASLAPSSDGGISYANGKIVWLTGANAGQTTEVKTADFDTGQIVLWALTVFVPEAGDTFSLFPGCAQDFETCADFGPGRELRFGGFPHVPGRDAITRSPDAQVGT